MHPSLEFVQARMEADQRRAEAHRRVRRERHRREGQGDVPRWLPRALRRAARVAVSGR